MSMCGICGLVTLDGAPDPALVDRMRAAIVHRGPDDGSTDAFGRCVLGHQRLIVVDPESGYQPVANESGDVVAVFNGELYNFPELRDELRGHEVRGRGDSPVIPHLYEEHGVDFVRRLEGMFAVALWDARRQRLVLARDRLGKKPLLYARLDDGTFAFASELKALLQLPVDRALDPEAVSAYLALGYVPGERTGLAHVRRLLPGHVLVLERGRERVEPYWRLEPEPGEEGRSDEEWIELVRDRVRAAVRRRLVADVPLGALLSGGIDSSVVVALMAEASPEPVRTFTVGFADDAYDERTWARSVAERFGTRHEEVVLETDVSSTIERLAGTLDEPLGDEAILPLYLICEAARRHVTVALTGDGGDEAFGGYERYAAMELAARTPRAAALAARLLPAGERRSRAARAGRFLELVGAPPNERYGKVMEVFPPDLRRELWAEDGAGASLPPPRFDGVRGLQALDVETYLAGDLLPKADLASMAHSLELRSPFLDREVVELGLALPDRLKVRGRRGKIALRSAFADVLPPDVADRGKAGFGLPLARWFRGELREQAYDVLRHESLFNGDAVERLLAEHQAGRADHGHRLWCLLVFELWRRTWIGAATPTPLRA